MFAKYFDSVSPAQIFKDVSPYLPSAHKNRTARTIREIDISYGVRGQPREIQYIMNESINYDIEQFWNVDTYYPRAYLWFDNNNEGYIWFHISDGGLGGNRLFHYVLNNPQSSAPTPQATPSQSSLSQSRENSRRQTVGIWVNERGSTVAVITGKHLDIAENILRWGKCERSGHRAIPINGVYRLNISDNGETAWDGLGNKWGGYNIAASFSLNNDGTLMLIIENSAYDVVENLGEYSNKQTFLLRKKM